MRRKIGLAHRQFWAGECSCAWGRRQIKKYVMRNEVSRPAKPDSLSGVVTLSLIDWNLPTAADFNAWYCIGLVCRSIVHIERISLNVTMPSGHLFVLFARTRVADKLIDKDQSIEALRSVGSRLSNSAHDITLSARQTVNPESEPIAATKSGIVACLTSLFSSSRP